MQLVRGSKRGRIAFALEIALAIAIFTATAMLGAHFQKPIGVDGWLGWDGPTYYSVAEQLSMVGRAHGDPPFVHRIGTALIAIAYAKLTHAPLATAFRSVNLGANVVLLGALVWLLRTYVGSLTVRVLALAAMVTHWASPFRMLYYMLSVDHVAQALVVLGVIAIHHARARETPLRVGAVILLSMMGAVTREITIVIPLAFAVAMLGSRGSEPFRRLARAVIAFAPLVGFFAAFLEVRRHAHAIFNDYDPLIEMRWWFYYKPIPVILHSWFLVFGIVPALLVAFRSEAVRFVRDAPHVAFVAAAYFLLAFIGGDSSERLLTFASPAVFAIVGHAVSRRPKIAGVAVAVAFVAVQALTNRVFWTIPEYPGTGIQDSPRVVLLAIGEGVSYVQHWSVKYQEIKQVDFQLFSLAQYLAVSIGVIVFCAVKQRRLARP